VKSIITSIKQYKSFSNMAKYNVSCLMSHITPPNPQFRENIQAAIQEEGLEALLELLKVHNQDLEMLRGATDGLSGLVTNADSAGKLAKAGGVEAALEAMLGLSKDVAQTADGQEVADAGSKLLEKVGTNNPGAILDSKGGVDAILDGVANTSNDRVKAACAVVADRVGLSDRGQKELLKKGALEAFVKAIGPGKETTEEVLKPTFRLLERFAQDPKNLKKMKDLGLVEALVLQLEAHSSNEGILRAGGRLLAKVAGDDLEAAIERLKRGGLSEEAREFTTALLANLALSPENVERIVQNGGVSVLIENFGQFSEKSQIAAARALGRLAMNKATAGEIIQKGGVEVLVEAMKTYPNNEDLVSACTQALSNLATSGKENAGAVDAKGGIAAVLNSLKEHPEFETNSQAALTMVSQLATIGFDANKLTEMGAVESILIAMASNLNSAEVQRSGFRALTGVMAHEQLKKGIKTAALAILSHRNGIATMIDSVEIHRSRDLVVVPAIECFAMLIQKERTAASRVSIDSIVSAVYTQMLAAALGSVQALGALSASFENHVRVILQAVVKTGDVRKKVSSVTSDISGVTNGKDSNADSLENALMSIAVFCKEPSLAKSMHDGKVAKALVESLKTLISKTGLPLQEQLMSGFSIATASYARASTDYVSSLDNAGMPSALIDTIKRHGKVSDSTICAMRALRAFSVTSALREKLVSASVIEACVGAMRANADHPFVALAALDVFLSLSSSDSTCKEVAIRGATKQAIKMIQDSSSSDEFERPTERALMVMERVASSKTSTEEIRTNLVKQGAVDATTKAMSSYPWNEQIEATGARLLSRLLDSTGVEAEIDKLEYLVGELKKSSRPDSILPKLARSMATVGALALTPANIQVMIKKNAAGIMIDGLKKIATLNLTKEREYARRAGFRALGQLASMNPLDEKLGANVLISDALSAPVSKVTLIEKIGVLNCIKSMAVVESAAAGLVKAGIAELVLKLLKEHSHDEALVTAAFGALASLAGHEVGAKRLTKLGCVSIGMELMRNFQDSGSPRFAEEGFNLLANLALLDSNIPEMLEGGIIDLVTTTLDQHCDDPSAPEPRVLTAAVFVLQRMATTENTIRMIVRKGAVRKVIQIAHSSIAYQSDPECMEAVLFLIETCALVKETHEALAKAGAVELVMSGMQLNATNENVAVVGSKALQALLGSNADTVKVLVGDIAKLAAALKRRPNDRDTQVQLVNALRNLGNLTLVDGVVNAKGAADISKTAVETMDTIQHAAPEGPAKQELLTAAIQLLGRTALIKGAPEKMDIDKAVKSLIAIIEANRGDDVVLESAMYALGNLATSPAAVRSIAAAGGIALLERTINESAENERLREAATRALDKMRIAAATGANALAKDAAGANALADILKANATNPIAMRDFLEEIGSSKTGVNDLLAILGATSMKDAPPNVRQELLRALKQQLDAGKDLKISNAADMAGLLAAFDIKTEGMTKAEKQGVLDRQKETVNILGAINPAGSAAAFVGAGGVDKLLEMIRNNEDDPDALKGALRALNRLAGDKNVVNKLVEGDATAAIMAAMKAHPDDEELNQDAVELLSKMAKVKGVGKAGMNAETMRLLNRVMDGFGGNKNIKKNAGKLVDDLSNIYKEDSADMVGKKLENALLAMGGSSHIKELYDENGKRYFYNTQTGQTTYDEPAEYRDANNALQGVAKLTESHRDNVQEVDPKVLEAAVRQLEQHSNEPQRIKDLTVAMGDIAKNEQNRENIAKVGGIEAIIAALNGENVDPDFLAAAIHLLNQFARNDYFKDQISKLGGIEALILIMLKFIEHLNVVEKCMSTLANLAYNSKKNMAEIMKYDGVDAVSKAMGRYPKEEELLQFAMILLSNLMYGNDDNKLVIGEKVGLQIIQVTRDHFRNPKLLKGALRALGNLSYADENILWIVQNGATKCIVAGMAANEDDLETQQLSIEVIGNFASFAEDDPAVRKKIERGEQSSVYDIIVVEGGAKRILDTVADTEEPTLMMSGVEALSNLANNPSVTEKLIKMGIVDVVFYAMQKYDWDEDLMERCMRLVAILTYSTGGVKAMGEANGVQTILSAMDNHEEQPEFLANAAAALKNIAADEGLREQIGSLGGVKTVLDLFEKNIEAKAFLLEAITLFIRLSRSEHLSEEIAVKGMNLILEAIALAKDDVQFLVPAFTLIGHLAFAEANLKVVVQYAGIDVIIDSILEHPESKPLVIRCIQTLDNLAMASAEHSKIVKDAGGEETIKEVQAAYEGDKEVVSVCKSALLSMQPEVQRKRIKPRMAFGERQEDWKPSAEDPLKDHRNLLKTGALFTEWSNGGPHSRHLLVKPDFKAIAWKDPKKTARTESTVLLRDVRNVRSGLHDGHKNRRKQADSKKAFSIICRATSIDLEASSQEDRDRWVAALSALVRTYKVEPSWLK